MPPGGALYKLTTAVDVLRAMFVVDENKGYADDTGYLEHGSAEQIVLPHPVRRIRVAVNDEGAFTKVWFCWGDTDRTGNKGGRILVHAASPFEMILERPETTFWFRRAHTSGNVTANIFGTK